MVSSISSSSDLQSTAAIRAITEVKARSQQGGFNQTLDTVASKPAQNSRTVRNEELDNQYDQRKTQERVAQRRENNLEFIRSQNTDAVYEHDEALGQTASSYGRSGQAASLASGYSARGSVVDISA